MAQSAANSGLLLRVITLGDSGVGKTCIMQRFCKDTFTGDSLTTVGSIFLYFLYLNDNIRR